MDFTSPSLLLACCIVSSFTCTFHSQPPPVQSVRQTPGVCGFLVVTAVSMTTAGCEGKRWGSVGCGWLHPVALLWCFPPCGTSLWWGDCCLLVVTANQLVSQFNNRKSRLFTDAISHPREKLFRRRHPQRHAKEEHKTYKQQLIQKQSSAKTERLI